MARKRFYLPKPKKCGTTGKTMFALKKDASFAMMRVWSHDPSVDILDMHTYQCPHCNSFHFGHKSYYEMSKVNDTVSIGAE